MDRKIFKLNDDVLSQIARLLQLAIVTQTDIVDNLRQLRLEEKTGGGLSLTPEYLEHDKQVVDSLFDTLEQRMAEAGEAN